MADANTGSAGTIRIEVSEDQLDAAANTSRVNWAFYLIERVTSNSTYQLNAKSASVDRVNVGTLWSGTFTFDWRPAGNQTTLIASGSYTHQHAADGSGSVTIQGNIGDTGTSGAGGPTSVSQALTLTTLTVVPGTPTSVAASRNSDTQISVSWSQSSASNGQPTSNDVEVKVNGGAFGGGVTMSPATSANLAAAANEKREYRVRASNSAGASAWSATSAPVYTTPAAPTNVAASKTGSDVAVSWTPNVAFTEHQHIVEHGVVDSGGAITWDGAALATVASGTSSYTHVAPDPAQKHVYRVRARNTDTGALSSATVQSNTVQLLTAPAKPTVPAPAAFQDKAAVFRLAWVHNPIDASTQTKHQTRYSLDGGSTWTTAAKTASTDQFLDYAANTWAANNAVTFQVRTKGSYDSGSDGDASYSPWSDSVTVTFKTKPVVTITAPAAASTLTQATLTVVLGFSQAESATFVQATIGLYQGTTLLEEIVSTTLAGTLFTTRVADLGSYTVKAVVRDSNGLNSAQVSSTFSVDYTEPVAAVVTVTYLPDSGIAQLNLTIPAAGGGFVAATSVTIDRIIDGVSENIVSDYPSAPQLGVLDTTPTIHGTNLYRVTTRSADGAVTVVEATLVTTEYEWAFMSKGSGYQQIVRFQLAADVQVTPTVDSALVKAAGRRRPIGLYSTTGGLVVSGAGVLAAGYGSEPGEIEALLLVPGKGCYRDPTGRRVFGIIAGSITRTDERVGQLTYTVTEAD